MLSASLSALMALIFRDIRLLPNLEPRLPQNLLAWRTAAVAGLNLPCFGSVNLQHIQYENTA